MANTIKLKRGSGSDPGSSDLSVGELAIRTDTAKLFTKNDAGSVAEIGSGTDSTKMPLAGGTFTGDVVFEGTGTNITFDRSADDFIFNDGAKAVFGTGLDLQIYHASNISTINDSYGDLRIMGDTIRIQRQAGGENFLYMTEGGKVGLYYDGSEKLETTSGGVDISGALLVTNGITLPDSKSLKLGDNDDLQIYHNGTNSYIDNHQGDLYIRGEDDHIVLQPVDGESAIVCYPNGAVNLYFDNSLKFQTTTNGVQIDGRLFTNGADYNYLTSNSSTTSTLTLKKTDSNADSIDYLQLRNNANSPKFIINGDGSVVMYDNAKLKLGNGTDLQIYHDGTNSYLANSTGVLRIRSDDLRLQSSTGEEYFFGTADGGAYIYHNNNLKLQTTSSGISVTGDVSTTGHIRIPDNMSLIAGTGSDLFIYHNGTHNYIDTISNKLHIRVADGENAIVANSNGAVELYHNATKRLETVDDGVYAIGNLGINRDGALAYGSTSTILEARASDASNSIFESATFRGGADHNGAGARVRIVQGTNRGLVLEGGRTSNTAFGAIGLTDQNGGITSSVHIDSAGTWFWGKTSQSSGTPGVELYKDGPHFMTRSAGGGTVLGLNDSTGTSGGIMKFYFQDVHKGSLQFTGSTFQTATASDYRLKENDVAISDGITRLKLLRPVRFNWKTDASKTYDGFIAHEVTPAVPEAVVGEKDGEISKRGEGYQMICQQTLIPLLTAALKEAVSKIELLEARVTTLEAA